MSKNQKQLDELDELSHLLDELNAGRQPKCDDSEISELLAVAKLVKNAGGPVCPPQHILDQTVSRALAGVQESKSKSLRVWWYSGTLGTAVAVLLAIGFNLLAPPDNRVSVAPMPSAASHDTLQRKLNTEVPPMVYPSDPLARPTPTDSATVNKQHPSIMDQQEKNLPVAQIPPLTESAKSPAAAKEELIIAEAAPQRSQSKSAYSTPAPVTDSAKSRVQTMSPLTIPGQKPDIVVTDRENGTVRQVYFKGTPQEIIITQRPRPKDTVNTLNKAQSSSPLKAVNNLDTINVVQVIIADQEVTIEGRQSSHELLKLSQSLTP